MDHVGRYNRSCDIQKLADFSSSDKIGRFYRSSVIGFTLCKHDYAASASVSMLSCSIYYSTPSLDIQQMMKTLDQIFRTYLKLLLLLFYIIKQMCVMLAFITSTLSLRFRCIYKPRQQDLAEDITGVNIKVRTGDGYI